MHKGLRHNTRNIHTSAYKRELAKAQLGNNIANHMSYIFSCILYDKFDMTFKQVSNFYEKVVERRIAWQDDDNNEITNESMLIYCIKKKIDAVAFVKSIPMSQKLYMADIKKGRAVLGADVNIESALLSTLLLSIPVLKETYKFSNKKNYYINMEIRDNNDTCIIAPLSSKLASRETQRIFKGTR